MASNFVTIILTISGSPDFIDYATFTRAVKKYLIEQSDFYKGKRLSYHIITGDGVGAEFLATIYAKEMKIPMTIRKADKLKHGNLAEFHKSIEMTYDSTHMLTLLLIDGKYVAIGMAKQDAGIVSYFDTE